MKVGQEDWLPWRAIKNWDDSSWVKQALREKYAAIRRWKAQGKWQLVQDLRDNVISWQEAYLQEYLEEQQK